MGPCPFPLHPKRPCPQVQRRGTAGAQLGNAVCRPRSSQLCRAGCGRGMRPCVPADNVSAPAGSCRVGDGTGDHPSTPSSRCLQPAGMLLHAPGLS